MSAGERCDNCRFVVGPSLSDLECHRRAPLVNIHTQHLWPAVREADWCGEYEPEFVGEPKP